MRADHVAVEHRDGATGGFEELDYALGGRRLAGAGQARKPQTDTA
jgi:hypothetical protein